MQLHQMLLLLLLLLLHSLHGTERLRLLRLVLLLLLQLLMLLMLQLLMHLQLLLLRATCGGVIPYVLPALEAWRQGRLRRILRLLWPAAAGGCRPLAAPASVVLADAHPLGIPIGIHQEMLPGGRVELLDDAHVPVLVEGPKYPNLAPDHARGAVLAGRGRRLGAAAVVDLDAVVAYQKLETFLVAAGALLSATRLGRGGKVRHGA